MKKILNTGQIRDADAYTMQQEPITSIDLMERACRAFTFWFTARFTTDKRVGIVCGTGNNGGDGLGIKLTGIKNTDKGSGNSHGILL